MAYREPSAWAFSGIEEERENLYLITMLSVITNRRFENMACYCNAAECPFRAEGVPMNCKICPYSDGEDD